MRRKKILRRIIRFIKSRFEYVSKSEIQKLKQIDKMFPSVLTTTETLDRIINNRLSISRFGDGEFDVCNHEKLNDPYQKPSKELSKRLIEILKVKDEHFLACIPPINPKHGNVKNYFGCLSFWQWYWLKRYDKIQAMLVNSEYGNSLVSRDAVFYENSVEKIKKLWNGRNVVFVYGKGGRFKENSILFRGGVKRSGIILAPATNAFEEYERIYSDCIKYDKNTLFLIALGPTATVLAYDLYKAGYQALDIGHMPNCYEQFLGETDAPESMPMSGNN